MVCTSDVFNNTSLDNLIQAIIMTGALGTAAAIHDRVLERIAGHAVARAGHEDDLGVGRLGHGLHRLEVADLHGGSGAQNVGRLAHELGGLDLGLGGDDLGFTDSLALRGHGERLLQLRREDDVLDEHALHLDAPAGGDVLDDLADGLGNLLAALNDVLEDAGADDVAEGGLGALHEGLADVGDAKGGLVRGDDVVVDDGLEAEGDVVFCHADLLGDVGRLDLDVDLEEVLGERVDLDEAGVDGLVEAAKLGDEADVALLDRLVRVGAADATRDSAHGADDGAEGVDWRRLQC